MGSFNQNLQNYVSGISTKSTASAPIHLIVGGNGNIGQTLVCPYSPKDGLNGDNTF